MSKEIKKDFEKSQVKVTVIETVTTSDYGDDVFKSLPINRELKRPNILKLIRAFQKVHPNGVSVLTVIRTSAWDGTPVDYLCDGHHRRAAALEFSKLIGKEVKLTFNIIEIDGKDTVANVGSVLQTINVNLGTWSPKDFTHHNATLGMKDYQTLSDMCIKYNMGESTMLSILGLGQYSMADYKNKEFKITDRAKAFAILEVIKKIGFNNPKLKKIDAFPHNYVKRTLIKKLITLDLPEFETVVPKIKNWIKENEKFSYEEQVFRSQLDEIFKKEVEEEENEMLK